MYFSASSKLDETGLLIYIFGVVDWRCWAFVGFGEYFAKGVSESGIAPLVALDIFGIVDIWAIGGFINESLLLGETECLFGCGGIDGWFEYLLSGLFHKWLHISHMNMFITIFYKNCNYKCW